MIKHALLVVDSGRAVNLPGAQPGKRRELMTPAPKTPRAHGAERAAQLPLSVPRPCAAGFPRSGGRSSNPPWVRPPAPDRRRCSERSSPDRPIPAVRSRVPAQDAPAPAAAPCPPLCLWLPAVRTNPPDISRHARGRWKNRAKPTGLPSCSASRTSALPLSKIHSSSSSGVATTCSLMRSYAASSLMFQSTAAPSAD